MEGEPYWLLNPYLKKSHLNLRRRQNGSQKKTALLAKGNEMISRDLASIRYPHRGESSRSGETCLQEKKSAALARIEAQLEEILSGRRNTEPEPHRVSSPRRYRSSLRKRSGLKDEQLLSRSSLNLNPLA